MNGFPIFQNPILFLPVSPIPCGLQPAGSAGRLFEDEND
jgi:hypothetical protein